MRLPSLGSLLRTLQAVVVPRQHRHPASAATAVRAHRVGARGQCRDEFTGLGFAIGSEQLNGVMVRLLRLHPGLRRWRGDLLLQLRDLAQRCASARMPLVGRGTVPMQSLLYRSGDAAPIQVSRAEVELRRRQAGFCGAAPPMGGLGIVDLDTATVFVGIAKIVLGGHRTLLGGASKPLRRLPVALRHTAPGLIQRSERELGIGIALLGEFTPGARGGGVITRGVGARTRVQVVYRRFSSGGANRPQQ